MSHEHNSSICGGCINKQVNHILDHLNNDITRVNENIYNVEITRNNNKKDIIICPICQERIFEKSPIHKTNCNHKFHAHCFILHCLKNDSCPVCREEIIEEDDNDDFNSSQSRSRFTCILVLKKLSEISLDKSYNLI